MKTTIELPDELFLSAKKKALEERTTLRQLFERGLRRELSRPPTRRRSRGPRIHWITARGGLPPGLNVADRTRMHDWIRRER